MTDPTIVKATNPADFLALVPTLMSYQPVNSIAMVMFGGARTMGVMRFDLPEPDMELAPVVSTISGYACRVEGADGVAIIVYSDEPATHALPLLDAIRTQIFEVGLGILDIFTVGSDGWGCKSQGYEIHPLTDIGVIPVEVAHMSVDRNQSAPPLPVIEDAFETPALLTVKEFDPDTLDVVSLAEMVATLPPPLLPSTIGLLAGALEFPGLRDTMLMQWIATREVGELALAAQTAWTEGHEYPQALAKRMWGEGDRPDVARTTRALESVLVAAALFVPLGMGAGALATAAWISWALGKSTRADDYARQALAIEPGHGLGEIVVTMVLAGHLPDWAFTGRNS